jgi:hypothetical protein
MPTAPRARAFAPGARVVIRDEEWIVRSAQSTAHSGTAVKVVGTSELVRDQEAVFLTGLDEVTPLDPEDTDLAADDSPSYRRARLYLESLLRRSPPTTSALAIGHQGVVREARYQWVPAAKALSALRPRLLLADGVGLGKTIEVGILLSELIRRGRGRRILVVAMKSLLAQLQHELWSRFTIPLVRLDSVGLQRVQSQIPASMNPFYVFDRVIISIDTLKKEGKYGQWLRECRWDAVVIDECQNVADRGGTKKTRAQRARLARLLAQTTDALVLTSATPHDGSAQSFASLLNLLDPTAVADPDNFQKSDVEHLFVRRFQKDIRHHVDGAFQERRLTLEEVPATPAEERALAAISAATFQTIGRQKLGKGRGKGVLFRTTLLKAWLSSPEACRETVENRLNHADLRRDKTNSEPQPAVDHDRAVLEGIRDACHASPSPKTAKLQRLDALMTELGWGPKQSGDKVVIFSERKATLDMLEAHLSARFQLKPTDFSGVSDDNWRPGTIAQFHGGRTDTEQYKLVADFSATKGQLRILLASDAAAEGLNLHHDCHRLVHYDVPWSLITLEQRNGRIDRYGQTAPPDIRYLITTSAHPERKADEGILKRLIDKEREANLHLGDAAWLLKLHDPDAEAELVGQGIEEATAPDLLLPDLEAGALDLLADLLGSASAEADAPLPEADPPLSLFADDLAFATEAFSQLCEDDPDVPRPEPQPHRSGLQVWPGTDLQRRYAQLPPELSRGRTELLLTTDRAVVDKSIDEARRDNAWPRWELLWPQHPVSEWLTDRVLALFRRHEAPVIRARPGALPPGTTAWGFQAVVSNRRSQPVLVDWFFVTRAPDGSLAVAPFPALARAAGLEAPLANPGDTTDRDRLSAHRAQVVAFARDHVDELSHARLKDLARPLRAEVRRLKAWAKAAKARIDAQEAQRKGIPAALQKRHDADRKHIDAVLAAQKEWVTDAMRPADHPFLRLALVLVGA